MTELVTNGTFDTDTSGWSSNAAGTLTVSSGRLRVTNNKTGVGLAYQQITGLIIGERYAVRFDQLGGSVGTNFRVGNNVNSIDYVATSVVGAGQSATIVPTQTDIFITPRTNSTTSGGWVEFDNISVQLLPPRKPARSSRFLG